MGGTKQEQRSVSVGKHAKEGEKSGYHHRSPEPLPLDCGV